MGLGYLSSEEVEARAQHVANRILTECGGPNRLPPGKRSCEVTAQIKKDAGHPAVIRRAEVLLTQSSGWTFASVRVIRQGHAKATLSI